MSVSTDSGLSRLHSETPEASKGILTAEDSSECPSCSELSQLRTSWANKLQRAITKLDYADYPRAMRMLVELKGEIRGASH